jgi:uncharacterized membrane protein YgaE (UPF0421/DUF939 family)
MVVMFKMTPEKKEKYTKKIDKMMDFLEEFKDCLEDGENYDEEWEEEPMYRSYRKEGTPASMRSRYSRRGGM